MGDVAAPFESLCPAGQVVVELGGTAGAYIDSLEVGCAPLVVSGSAQSWQVSLAATMTLDPAGGDGGLEFSPLVCPGGSAAVGLDWRTGFFIDVLQLVCREPLSP
jgi:hypothetical protein